LTPRGFSGRPPYRRQDGTPVLPRPGTRKEVVVMSRRTQLILLLWGCAAGSLAGGLSQVLADSPCFWECRNVRLMQVNEDLEWNGIVYWDFPVCWRFVYDTSHAWPNAGTDMRSFYKTATTGLSPCPPSQRPARVGSGLVPEGDWRPTWCYAYCWTPH
jgi:hypothetical protein